MKGTLRIASILSWISLLFWGLNVGTALLSSLASFNPVLLVMLVLVASIPLHSYAALQLHKSIRKPEVKLSQQTPAGIRFVGLVALLFGFIFLLTGMVMARNAPTMLAAVREQGFMKEMYSDLTADRLRTWGFVILALGLVTIVNVILNVRLLRWYYLVRQSDAP